MKTGSLALGATAGLLLALIFVGSASLLGPAASHVDLIHAATSPAGQSGLGYPTGDVVTTAPSTQATTESVSTPVVGPSISSLSAISTDSGTSLGLLFLPIALGVLIGALFYGLFSRRANAE